MSSSSPPRAAWWLAAGLATTFTGCGGGGALDNPATIANPAATTGQKLSFAYFQRCVNPVLNALLAVNINGSLSTNTCASGGCHDNTSGTGGALRLLGSAPALDLATPGLTADAIRSTDMYKNFYSSQGEAVIGSPTTSRLLTKPLLLNVLHGGGLIFDSLDNANARLLRYWISRPMPQGQDEFGSAAAAMFTPADPNTGACNVE